ncbi:MAG: tetratricopeptide repeat protein [Burkholderiales bacterium]|nr:tetratricopeptide repeat protein [Burkholderiales bacterium]
MHARFWFAALPLVLGSAFVHADAVDEHARSWLANADAMRAIERVATTLQSRGDAAGAIRLREQVARVARRGYGPTHTKSIDAIGKLALTHYEFGDARSARQLWLEALEVIDRSAALPLALSAGSEVRHVAARDN